MNFKAVLALPKTTPSAQTYKSITFIWIVWSTLYVYLWLFPRLSSGGKEINHVLTAQTKTEHWSLVEISARLFCFCPTALTITMVNSHRRDNQNYWKLLVFPKAKVLQKNLAGCLIFIGPDMKCVQNKLFAWSKHEVQFFLPNIYNSF